MIALAPCSIVEKMDLLKSSLEESSLSKITQINLHPSWTAFRLVINLNLRSIYNCYKVHLRADEIYHIKSLLESVHILQNELHMMNISFPLRSLDAMLKLENFY